MGANVNQPLFLVGLFPLLNHSFEDDADGVDPPTNWTKVLIVGGGKAEVDDFDPHSAGTGIPSAKSVAMSVTVGFNDVIEIKQRVAIPNAIRDFAIATGVPISVITMTRMSNISESDFWFTYVSVYEGGTSTPGSGTLKGSSGQAILYHPASPTLPTTQWHLTESGLVLNKATHSAIDWLDVRINADSSSTNQTMNVDRVFAGFRIGPFARGYASIRSRPDTGFRYNEGDGGAIEGVQVVKPSQVIDVRRPNILTVDADYALWQDLERFHNEIGGPIAFWRDVEQWTNDAEHVQRAYIDPSYRVTYPPGIERRNFGFRIVAPSEGRQ